MSARDAAPNRRSRRKEDSLRRVERCARMLTRALSSGARLLYLLTFCDNAGTAALSSVGTQFVT